MTKTPGPVTVAEALMLFKKEKIPDYLYVHDGELGNGECHGIEELDGKWATYYSEHGQKSTVAEFETEAAAVEDWVRTVLNKE